MKKLLAIVLATVCVLSFSACGDNEKDKLDDKETTSANALETSIDDELTAIENELGNIANDYLNFDITSDEANSKLKILEARTEKIGEKVDEEFERFYKSDEYNNIDLHANDDRQETINKQRYSRLDLNIMFFKTALHSDKYLSDIVEIRDKYYKK